MSEWRRICCPVDFSPSSRAAVAEAVSLARSVGGEILLLHVRPSAGIPGGTPFAPPEHAEPADPAHLLEEWTAEAQRTVPTTSVEVSGDAATEIARFAAEFRCDLLVMGTHGRTGLRHLALGSVAEAVVRTAPCSVLVVRRPTSPG